VELINRTAVIVRPLEPYLKWIRRSDQGGLADDVYEGMRNEEPHIYLLPEYQVLEEREALFDEFWAEIFEAMLAVWCTDSSTWPDNRTIEMFKRWFEIQMTPAVDDLIDDEPIGHG